MGPPSLGIEGRGVMEIKTIDTYVEWLVAEKGDLYGRWARAYWQYRINKDGGDDAAEYPYGKEWPIADRSMDHMSWDLDCLIHHGYTPGYFQRYLNRQAQAIARRKETMEYRRSTGNGRARDSQRKRLYDAERVLPKGRIFSSIEEMQSYVDRLVRSAWFGKQCHAKEITILLGRSGTAATASDYGSRIKMPKWAWNEHILLHEVAHLMANRIYGLGVAGHGREYARTYVILVQHMMGKEAGDLLKKSFREHKVKYSLPRKPMTEEQRQAAAQRLAKAREVKAA